MLRFFRGLWLLSAGITIALAPMNPIALAAEEITVDGKLDLASDTYEGFRFATFTFDVSDRMVSVEGISRSFDAFIMIRSPEGIVFTNDDSSNFDAKIDLDDATQGNWLTVVTSSRPLSEGAFQLKIKGARNLKQCTQCNSSPEIIHEVFAARGVENRLQILSEQIAYTQASRKQWRRKFKECIAANGDLLPSSSSYKDLVAQRLEILRALDGLAEDSNSLVLRRFAEQRLSEIEAHLQRIEENEKRREASLTACTAALMEVDRLFTMTDRLDILENRLFSDPIVSGNLAAITASEIRDLRISIRSLAETITRNILKSDDMIRHTTESISPLYYSAQGRLISGDLSPSGAPEEGILRNLAPDIDLNLSELSSTQAWLPNFFPWPPPAASSKWIITADDAGDRSLGWDARFRTLGDLDTTLAQALEEAGYSDRSYFGVPSAWGGFVLVTRLEQTDADGIPLAGTARWATVVAPIQEFTLKTYLKALLAPAPGYFRVLAIVVAPLPFSQNPAKIDLPEMVRLWSEMGHNSLPSSVTSLPYSSDYRTTVLVYEFLKKNDTDNPIVSVPGRLLAKNHLASSGFLAALFKASRATQPN